GLVQQLLLGDALEFAADLAAFVLDEHGRYIAVNDFVCQLTGYTREELLGLEIGTLNPHLAVAYAERRMSGTTAVRSRTGERVQLRYRASDTKVGGMSFIVVV